jgi:hypothetical protein
MIFKPPYGGQKLGLLRAHSSLVFFYKKIMGEQFKERKKKLKHGT